MGTTYKVNEIFRSLQGEGIQSGRDCVFIRFSGCNLKCPWCDTDHKDFKEMSVADIRHRILSYQTKSIILTGGEPTLQTLQPLLRSFEEHPFEDYWIGLETNGTKDLLPIRKFFDWVTISPKKMIAQKAFVNELRVPVDSKTTEEYLAKLESHISAEYYLLSPVNGIENLIFAMKLLGKMNKDLVKWGISLQLHKLAKIK